MSARLQLPKVLKEQIESERGRNIKIKKKQGQDSRKEQRKQCRLEKKQRKSDYFSKSSQLETHTSRKRPNDDAGIPRKKPRLGNHAVGVSELKDFPKQAKTKELNFDPALFVEAGPEDAEIRRLEKLLERNGGKKKAGKSFDSFLSELDSFLGDAEFSNVYRDDKFPAEDSTTSDSGSEEDSDQETLGPPDHAIMDSGDILHQCEESEWGGIDQLDDEGPVPREPTTSIQGLPNIGIKYVPPHLRLKQMGDDRESLLKIKRRLKGMLNRLTEQNIATILAEIEDSSRNERRHDIIAALTELILESLNSPATLPDSFMVLHAAFISAMYRVMGIDFAAHFVTELINSYEKQYKALLSTTISQEDTSKGCTNLLVLVSGLYVFQVISCVVVFDIIRELLSGGLHEAEVELLLKLVQGCGQRLRQDDPEALKEIHDTMLASISAKEINLSSRSRFMVEAMGHLKSNKPKRSVTSLSASESAEKLKKFLSGLNKNFHVKSHEPLRFTLADIRFSETKGKWWLVGAAWSGDPVTEKNERTPEHTLENNENERLLKLARKQGMNTDIRRSIFLVLMTSEDYLDAFERLTGLHLTEIQQREIIRVLFHCSGSETTYNPYYTFVVQKLCAGSHSHKVTLQYCLWDFLRDLGEERVGGAEIVKNFSGRTNNGQNIPLSKISNIARALAWWIVEDAVSLTAFKAVDFTVIQPQTRKFVEIFFHHLFITCQSTSPLLKDMPHCKIEDKTLDRESLELVFDKATEVPTLAQGLLYIIPSIFKKKSQEDKFLYWCLGVVKTTLRNGLHDLDEIL